MSPPDAAMPFTARFQALEGDMPFPESHARFIMEQESAVQRDFDAGRISQQDYDSFRAVSEAKLHEYVDEVRAEVTDVRSGLDEVRESHQPDVTGAKADLDAVTDRFGPDALKSVDRGDTPLVDSVEIASAAATDLEAQAAMFRDEFEQLDDRMPEVAEVFVGEGHDMAQALVDARANMSGADQEEVNAAQQALDQIDASWAENVAAVETGLPGGDGMIDNDLARLDAVDEGLEFSRDRLDSRAEYLDEHPDATVQEWKDSEPKAADESQGSSD